MARCCSNRCQARLRLASVVSPTSCLATAARLGTISRRCRTAQGFRSPDGVRSPASVTAATPLHRPSASSMLAIGSQRTAVVGMKPAGTRPGSGASGCSGSDLTVGSGGSTQPPKFGARQSWPSTILAASAASALPGARCIRSAATKLTQRRPTGEHRANSRQFVSPDAWLHPARQTWHPTLVGGDRWPHSDFIDCSHTVRCVVRRRRFDSIPDTDSPVHDSFLPIPHFWSSLSPRVRARDAACRDGP